MSSAVFKKASKSVQRIHKERSQPTYRANLGHLEKKKDYKVRAKHREEREEKLKHYKKLAEERNPDEFSRKMINAKLMDGVHTVKSKRKALDADEDADQIKLIYSQDKKYVEHRRLLEDRKAEKLKSNLHMIQEGQKNKQTFFVDTKKEVKEFDAAKQLRTHPALLDRAYNRPTLDQLKEMSLKKLAPSPRHVAEATIAKQDAYKELKQRIDRERKLSVVRDKLAVKELLAKERGREKVLVKAASKNQAAVYKFKPRRKK